MLLFSHSHIYFFGDMNYRINPQGLNIRQYASGSEFRTLLGADQLIHQKKLNRVFKGYKEGDITFRPTFKYDLHSDNWDSR